MCRRRSGFPRVIRSDHGAALRKTKHRGLARVASDFLLNIIAYNLIRIPKLIAV